MQAVGNTAVLRRVSIRRVGPCPEGRAGRRPPAKETMEMLKRIALPLIATLACAGGALKDQARDAMPSKEAISIGSPASQPQASSTSGSSTIAQNSTAGDRSQFHDLTVAVAVVFNVPTAAFLDLLRHVVEDYDPTSCDATACPWGPGPAPLRPSRSSDVGWR